MGLKEPYKIRVKKEDLEMISNNSMGEIMAYKGTTNLFSGYCIDSYHNDGNVGLETEYKTGENRGWENLYYENGQLKESRLRLGNYVDVANYEYDQNGNLTYEFRDEDDEYMRLVKTYNLLDL